MKFGKRDLWILECVRQAFFAARIRDVILASDAAKWITVHPNGKGMTNSGENAKGTPVLLDEETGEVLGGMGGKFTGMHISEACSTEPTENSQHIIRRGQEKRKNPEAFEAEQQRKMDEAAAAAAKAQEKAAAQAEAEKKKAEEAKAKAEKKQRKEDTAAERDQAEAQVNKAQKVVSAESAKQQLASLNDTSNADEINAALDSMSCVKFDRSNRIGRHEERHAKVDAIQRTLFLKPVEVAKAYTKRVKEVGPPDLDAVKDNEHAREYLQKLLPGAQFNLDDSLQSEFRADTVKTIHYCLSLYPALGNYISSVGDIKALDKVSDELSILKRQKTIAAKPVAPKAMREELKQAKAEVKKLENELNNGEWKAGGEAHQKASEELKKVVFGSFSINVINDNPAFAARALAKNGLQLKDAREIMDNLSKRTEYCRFFDQEAWDQAREALRKNQIRLRCEAKTKELETAIKEKYKDQLQPAPESKLEIYDRDKYADGCSKNVDPKAYAYMSLIPIENPGNGHKQRCGALVLGPNTTGTNYDRTEKTLNEKHDRCEKSGFTPKRRSDMSGVEATVTHELGHALDGSLSSSNGRPFSYSPEFVAVFNEAEKEWVGYAGARPYWLTNPLELLAEAFKAKHAGDKSAMTPLFAKVCDMVDKEYKKKFGVHE